MSQSSIQLVCFDIGGVLIRLCNSWLDALERAGIEQSHRYHRFHHHSQFDEINHQFERGQISQDGYAERLSDVSGMTADQVLAVFNAWLVEPYPGVDRLLDRLDTTAVHTACLSNTNHTHWRAMTSPGPLKLPLDRLHYRFASPFIGQRKPDAAIYQHVQHETAVQPQNILFFDDLPENIQTAHRLGWQAYRIDPHGDPMNQAAACLQDHGIL